MSDLRTAAQQALEALGLWATGRDMDAVALNDLIHRLESALAEPVQEPVAWRITDGEGDWEYCTYLPEDWSIQWSARYGRKYEPLYTTPPQRKPLTDEEIGKMWVGILEATHPSGVHEDGLVPFRFARAIERAHGIE